MRTVLSSALLLCAASYLSIYSANAQTRPSPKASAATGAPTNIVQLCKFKESQIVQMNALIGTTLMEMNTARDANKQAEHSNRYQALRGVMVEMEESWQRLGCIHLQSTVNRDLMGR